MLFLCKFGKFINPCLDVICESPPYFGLLAAITRTLKSVYRRNGMREVDVEWKAEAQKLTTNLMLASPAFQLEM